MDLNRHKLAHLPFPTNVDLGKKRVSNSLFKIKDSHMHADLKRPAHLNGMMKTPHHQA